MLLLRRLAGEIADYTSKGHFPKEASIADDSELALGNLIVASRNLPSQRPILFF
jgi:hypothetical protein